MGRCAAAPQRDHEIIQQQDRSASGLADDTTEGIDLPAVRWAGQDNVALFRADEDVTNPLQASHIFDFVGQGVNLAATMLLDRLFEPAEGHFAQLGRPVQIAGDLVECLLPGNLQFPLDLDAGRRDDPVDVDPHAPHGSTAAKNDSGVQRVYQSKGEAHGDDANCPFPPGPKVPEHTYPSTTFRCPATVLSVAVVRGRRFVLWHRKDQRLLGGGTACRGKI
ncbi:MAG: hypothetical protein A2W31_18705 [Planctomycetes bacterium RBG_16_64_10]|nr:MAG: hypothetical protein A2W31_18705 [Planctomycetes bacterium RBG_16_64_10]